MTDASADLEPLWEMCAPNGDTEQEVTAVLPPVARRVVDAVREGTAGGLFPPVVTAGPEDTVGIDRLLTGAADARMLAHALEDQRFAPLLASWDRLDNWCAHAARRYATVVAPGVLDITNADLFGPVVSEAFVACATGRAHYARDRVAEWAATAVRRCACGFPSTGSCPSPRCATCSPTWCTPGRATTRPCRTSRSAPDPASTRRPGCCPV